MISKLPRFIPAKLNGRPVSVWFRLPVRFRFADDYNSNTNTNLILIQRVHKDSHLTQNLVRPPKYIDSSSWDVHDELSILKL